MYPAFVNCTTIDWFHEWPQDALLEVADRYLADMDLGGEENVSLRGVPTARPLVRCDRMSSRSGIAAWVVAVELCTAGKYRTSDLDDQLASTRGLGCRPV